MKNIYISSAYTDDIVININNSKTYAKYVFENEAVPIIPQFYSLVLGDEKGTKQKIQKAGMSLLWLCDEVWVIGNKLTEQMKKEIKFAQQIKINIRYISNEMIMNRRKLKLYDKKKKV